MEKTTLEKAVLELMESYRSSVIQGMRDLLKPGTKEMEVEDCRLAREVLNTLLEKNIAMHNDYVKRSKYPLDKETRKQAKKLFR